MNEKIKQLAESTSAINAISLDLIRCGFELEFQKLNGCTSSDGSTEIDYDSEPDYDALSDNSFCEWKSFWNVSLSDRLTMIKQHSDCDYKLKTKLDEIMVDKTPSTHSEFRTILKTCDDLITIYDEVETEWRQEWEEHDLENNGDRYYPEIEIEGENVYESLDLSKSARKDVDCGSDCSVSGGEIRTLGPLSPMRFLEISNELLDDNNFEVDEGCSFHIHLSVPGVKHSYGKAFQAEMIAYLLDNIARMPKGVQERIAHDKCHRYACPQLSREKFTAVHFHAQGTWEFRIFGNVNDSDAAKVCLMLAIEAMRHAYRVRLNLSLSLVNTDHVQAFNKAAEKAARLGKPFKTFIKAERKSLRAA